MNLLLINILILLFVLLFKVKCIISVRSRHNSRIITAVNAASDIPFECNHCHFFKC